MAEEIPALYHISFDHKLPRILKPRAPWGGDKEPMEEKPSTDPDAWIFAEFTTPRVSFSTSIDGCVRAIYPNYHELFHTKQALKEGVEFAVYRYDPKSNARMMTPKMLCDQRAVWDAHFNDEYCFLDPVSVYYCGSILVRTEDNVVGTEIHPFNDKNMKKIKTVVPTGDDLTFTQTLRLRGDKYRLKFF